MQNIKQAINNIRDKYVAVVNDKGFDHLNFEVESKIALRLVANSIADRIPLTKVSPDSVAHALFNAGAMGISLSPAVDHAMISGEASKAGQLICKLHLTYKGLLHLCSEAGAISHVTTWVIHEQDKVRMTSDVTSKPQIDIDNLFGDRGPVVGSMCTICTPSGDYLTTTMKAAELNQIAVMSGNDAWFGEFADEFRKKQVLKRALHSVASSHHGRLADAAKHLSKDDLDLYETTERSAMSAPRPRTQESTKQQTRGEIAFQRGTRKKEEAPITLNTPKAQTGGLMLQ